MSDDTLIKKIEHVIKIVFLINFLCQNLKFK